MNVKVASQEMELNTKIGFLRAVADGGISRHCRHEFDFRKKSPEEMQRKSRFSILCTCGNGADGEVAVHLYVNIGTYIWKYEHTSQCIYIKSEGISTLKGTRKYNGDFKKKKPVTVNVFFLVFGFFVHFIHAVRI